MTASIIAKPQILGARIRQLGTHQGFSHSVSWAGGPPANVAAAGSGLSAQNRTLHVVLVTSVLLPEVIFNACSDDRSSVPRFGRISGNQNAGTYLGSVPHPLSHIATSTCESGARGYGRAGAKPRSMSCDSGQTEYHLTPRGWLRGTESYFDRVERVVAPPPDRVETWVRRVIQPPDCVDCEVTWQQIWRSHDVTVEERQALLRRFSHPRSLTRAIK